MIWRTSTSTILAALFVGMAAPVMPHEPAAEGCGGLSHDLAHELSIMRGVAVPATAVTGSRAALPQLELDRYYAVSLVPQESVRFAAKPRRAAKSPSLRAGVFQFAVPAAGRYRVAISSRHWIDVLDAAKVIDSVDHFGPGCELVHKVVEFDLPTGRPLTLQLSGHDDAMVGLTITASPRESR
jgi:hypothetical protein